MRSEEFRKQLVDMVKACGQEVIDRAEDLVGNGDLISGFSIYLNFPADGSMLTSCPTININREYISKNAYDVIIGKDI